MNSLKYLGYGLLAQAALKAYFAMPREGLQSELLTLHRWALKKAHTARMRNETREDTQYEVCGCGAPASLNLGGKLYCSKCSPLQG